jgi:hypothetical protein
MTLVVFFVWANYNPVEAGEIASHKEEKESACSFKVGKERVNFTAYQPRVNHMALCRKIPEATGVTYFSLDLIDKVLPERALKLKITPISQGGGELQTISPVMSFEVSSSPGGVVSFEHDFQGGLGRYRLDVVNEMDSTQGSFEFEVGEKELKWSGKFGQKVAFGMFGAFALFILGYISLRKKKT